MRVVLSGGGTGGHISPLLAVANKLKELAEAELLYIGSKGGMEERLVPGAGIPYRSISAGKVRRYGRKFIRAALDLPTNLRNIADLGKTVKGYLSALRILRKFKPDVVLLKGGYVSLPVGLAAVTMRIPFAIHESDAEAGLANRFLARYADRVFISFPLVWLLPKEKTVYTGSPVRSDINTHERSPQDYIHFGLKTQQPVVLIIGGSQGAHEINIAVFGALKELLAQTQMIHITGARDFAWLKHEQERLDMELRARYFVASYLSTELPAAYRISNLVVARAGANVMAEIAAVSKPSILIPHIYGGTGHQLKNAQVFGREGASTILRPDELTSSILRDAIFKELSDPKALQEKARRASALYKKDAAEIIARELTLIVERARRSNMKVQG